MALRSRIAPAGLLRLVLWMPGQGHRIDVAAKDTTGDFVFGSRTFGHFAGGDGSDHMLAQEDTFEATILPSTVLAHLRQMAYLGCDAKVVAFSYTDHLSWQQPVRWSLADLPGGRSAGARLRLVSRVVRGHVYRGESLSAGYPWYGAVPVVVADYGATKDYRLTAPGHRTDTSQGWFIEKASTAPSVSGTGVLSANDALGVRLDMEFPCPGAQLRMETPGFQGIQQTTLRALDFSGNVLVSVLAGTTLTVPEKTWTLRFNVVGTPPITFGFPEILITKTGAATGVSYGVNNPCGTALSTPPPWST